jgi:hypothetical protein
VTQLAFAVGLLVLACGCGGTDLGQVTGKVTMNGQPLANVEVEFQPADNGRPSSGVTNAEGVYELQFSSQEKGALIGEHTVRINAAEGGDGDDEENPAKPTVIPAKYNTQSTLKKTVNSGQQTIDFDL